MPRLALSSLGRFLDSFGVSPGVHTVDDLPDVLGRLTSGVTSVISIRLQGDSRKDIIYP